MGVSDRPSESDAALFDVSRSVSDPEALEMDSERLRDNCEVLAVELAVGGTGDRRGAEVVGEAVDSLELDDIDASLFKT